MKPNSISVPQAKARLSKLLIEVQKGQSFGITMHGKSVAELGAIGSESRSWIGRYDL